MKYIDIHGTKHENNSSQDKLLTWLYANWAGRLLLRPLVSPVFSKAAGHFLDGGLSRGLIRKFIEANQIDMSDYENTG